ncbi:MAG: DUF5050 domain-containing protein [Propionibacteriaceae bacterium]|jgi:hypothetical protein|nr:DUF5050 domain-containing protein [Propionibacteriaceae bacterium]
MVFCNNNIMYGGNAVYADGQTYMANPSDGWRLYRFDENFDNGEKLLDTPVTNISVAMECLWFRTEAGFCRMGLAPGAVPERLLGPGRKFVYVLPDGLYFRQDIHLMKTDLSGKNESVLFKGGSWSEVDEVLVTEEGIFFTIDPPDPALRRCDLDGGNYQDGIGRALNLTLAGDYLYFCEGDADYAEQDFQCAHLTRRRVFSHDSADDTPLHKSTIITRHDVAHVIADQGLVYFQDRDHGRRLQCYNPADGTFHEVTDSAADSPQFVGDKIFLKNGNRWTVDQIEYRVITKSGLPIRSFPVS